MNKLLLLLLKGVCSINLLTLLIVRAILVGGLRSVEIAIIPLINLLLEFINDYFFDTIFNLNYLSNLFSKFL